jgi:hypothetical protein
MSYFASGDACFPFKNSQSLPILFQGGGGTDQEFGRKIIVASDVQMPYTVRVEKKCQK